MNQVELVPIVAIDKSWLLRAESTFDFVEHEDLEIGGLYLLAEVPGFSRGRLRLEVSKSTDVSAMYGVIVRIEVGAFDSFAEARKAVEVFLGFYSSEVIPDINLEELWVDA